MREVTAQAQVFRVESVRRDNESRPTLPAGEVRERKRHEDDVSPGHGSLHRHAVPDGVVVIVPECEGLLCHDKPARVLDLLHLAKIAASSAC